MANRRKRNQMDPKRINEYNNFLSTLDQKSILNKDTKDVKENVDNGIDLLIEAINNKFINDRLFLFNFTGQNTNDVFNVNYTDPNYYRDIIKPICVKGTSYFSKKFFASFWINFSIPFRFTHIGCFC